MTGDAVQLRLLDDAGPLRGDGAPISNASNGSIALLAERAGTLRASASLDPAGCATEPDQHVIRLLERADDADLEIDVKPLISALIERAANDGAERIIIGWDPMDAKGLRMLESLGFRPTGSNPYFELGPGNVEFVSGYQDATGSILDLSLRVI